MTMKQWSMTRLAVSLERQRAGAMADTAAGRGRRACSESLASFARAALSLAIW